jgi:phytoene/squalene synthetase
MSDADRYRQYAIDCERIARTMTGEQRSSLLAIAEAWRELAREAERKSAPDSHKPKSTPDRDEP